VIDTEKLLLLSHGAHPDLAKAEEFRLQGNACFKQGQLMAALQAWSKGVHLEPSSTLLYNNLSLAFLKMGRNDEVSCQ
jgi:Flp pilus assembly protein TadD